MPGNPEARDKVIKQFLFSSSRWLALLIGVIVILNSRATGESIQDKSQFNPFFLQILSFPVYISFVLSSSEFILARSYYRNLGISVEPMLNFARIH